MAGGEGRLVGLCIETASRSKESVEKWRRQRRTLERLPTHLADALLRNLLRRRLVSPSLLEVFQHSIEEIDLKGESCVDAEWMAYLGAFRYLHALNIADCRGINNSALWPITGMTSLEELDLSRCSKVTDAGMEHLLSIPNLRKLCISETGLTADAVSRLSSFQKLCILDLGGLPVTDQALCSLQGLTQLEYLDLWGSKISNKGAAILTSFPKLNFLNLAWTSVTKMPNLPALTCLNMSRCTIESIFVGHNEVRARLTMLLVPGATFVNVQEVFSYLDASSLTFFDVSASDIQNFGFLEILNRLEHLDLSFSRIEDFQIESVASIGANLRDLNLSHTKVSSRGIAILAGNVPNLEILSLSHTAVDDNALSYISLMASLRTIRLSNTSIKGIISTKDLFCLDLEHLLIVFNAQISGYINQSPGSSNRCLSLALLQVLNQLEVLDLEDTQVRDGALRPLSVLRELSHLSLKSDFLSDISLFALSSLPKLKSLRFRGAVLTNDGLNLFQPPATLRLLDLRECWLLTSDMILVFCKNHPQIDVKHEHFRISSFSQNVGSGSSPMGGTTRPSQLKFRRGKAVGIPNELNRREHFADERIKYNRDELLKLQSVCTQDPSLLHGGSLLPSMLLNDFSHLIPAAFQIILIYPKESRFLWLRSI
ncbi:hypothetical protein ACLOJK_009970 [Asimina triloba]